MNPFVSTLPPENPQLQLTHAFRVLLEQAARMGFLVEVTQTPTSKPGIYKTEVSVRKVIIK